MASSTSARRTSSARPGSLHLNAPVVGIAAAPDNAGYWTFASDGGVFNYGTGSQFKGSAGSLHLNKPVVGGAAT